MLKRALIALLATPLIAIAAVAIMFAVRQNDEPDPTIVTPPASPSAGDASERTVAVAGDRSPRGRVDRIGQLIEELHGQRAGVPASIQQLQLLTEELASMTAIVRDAEPAGLQDRLVTDYFAMTVTSLQVLEGLLVAEGAEAALISARGIAEFGRDTVAQYLVDTQFEVNRRAAEAELKTADGT
jgi:hypothetical protein